MKKFIFLISLALLITACDEDFQLESTPTNPEQLVATATQTGVVKRKFKFTLVQQGYKLYRANCAACHGDQGQGAANWRQTGADGKSPAPPLAGTGHAWHHPMPVLVSTIKNGTQRIGGNMPAWKDRLSDADINAVIVWFQSRWPDELYQAWARMDQQAARSTLK